MNLVLKYFHDLSNDQLNKFTQLSDIYPRLNSKINLVSRKDIEFLCLKHILHSLSIAKFINFSNGTRVLDLGTGGGFPGIPLSIMFPNVEFILNDSKYKKIEALRIISKNLNLKNVSFDNGRVENLNEEFEFIVSRAVAKISVINKWVGGKISNVHNNVMPNGIIYLKGGNLKEEIKGIDKLEVINISKFYSEEFFVSKKIIYQKFC